MLGLVPTRNLVLKFNRKGRSRETPLPEGTVHKSVWHIYRVPALNLVEGSAATLIGVLLMLGARRIAGIYRDHPTVARFFRVPKFWQRNDVIRVCTMFWIFCGILWLLGGLSLALNLSPTLRFAIPSRSVPQRNG